MNENEHVKKTLDLTIKAIVELLREMASESGVSLYNGQQALLLAADAIADAYANKTKESNHGIR